MTHDYKQALDDLMPFLNASIVPFSDCAKVCFCHSSAIRSALQLAQEAEQIKKRLAELETLLAQANNKIQWYERTEATND